MFDLTITFAGICLLVPDRSNGMLHVLMPHTDDTGMPHIPTLVFVDEAGVVRHKPIAGMHLELPDVTGSDNFFDPAIPAEVFNFGGELGGGRAVDRTLLIQGTELPEEVRARMCLRAGRHGGTYRRGGFWDFEQGEIVVTRRLPTAVHWVVHDLEGRNLVIHDTIGGETFILHPDCTGSIRALVVHVTQAELDVIGPDIPPHSKCPAPAEEAMHLDLYRPLLTPSTKVDAPLFNTPRSKFERVCPPSLGNTQPSPHTPSGPDAVVGTCGPPALITTDAESEVLTAAAATDVGAESSGTDTHTDHSDHSKHGQRLRGAAGSELTCMVATAPPG